VPKQEEVTKTWCLVIVLYVLPECRYKMLGKSRVGVLLHERAKTASAEGEKIKPNYTLDADNSYVQHRMHVSCDYFIGTMGSTWSLIVDDLRRTSGKESKGNPECEQGPLLRVQASVGLLEGFPFHCSLCL